MGSDGFEHEQAAVHISIGPPILSTTLWHALVPNSLIAIGRKMRR